jgi:hypothetical protein
MRSGSASTIGRKISVALPGSCPMIRAGYEARALGRAHRQFLAVNAPPGLTFQ